MSIEGPQRKWQISTTHRGSGRYANKVHHAYVHVYVSHDRKPKILPHITHRYIVGSR